MFPALTTGPTANQCFDRLVRWRKGADGVWGPQPGLAESWELGDKAATFKLRKGVKFHDGSDLNAEAVRWQVQTWMQHPKSLAKTDLPGIDASNPAEVVDDYTLKINLKGPYGSLLAGLSDGTQTTGISSKVAYEKLGDDGMKLQAVGTGPFIFESWQSGAQLVVNKNPNYWDKGLDGQALPYVDKIVYRFVPDDSVRLNELRSGNADVTELIRGRDVPAAQADPNLVYVEDKGNGNRYRFFFNALKGAFKQLMQESGVQTPMPLLLSVIQREADQQQGQILQAMLDKVGIKVNLEVIERIAYGVKIREQSDFEMGTQRTNAALDPDPLFTLGWLENGPAAYSRAHVPEIQSCIDEGRASYDPAQRQKTYVRCQTMMYETAWWGYLWLQPWNYLFNKRVKNVRPMFATFWREEQMWLE